MAEVQYAPGTTIFVPSDANGWEAMTVDSCKGFGEAATIRAHQTAASARGGSSVRVLRQEEVSRIQECDVLALEGVMVKFAKLSRFERSSRTMMDRRVSSGGDSGGGDVIGGDGDDGDVRVRSAEGEEVAWSRSAAARSATLANWVSDTGGTDGAFATLVPAAALRTLSRVAEGGAEDGRALEGCSLAQLAQLLHGAHFLDVDVELLRLLSRTLCTGHLVGKSGPELGRLLGVVSDFPTEAERQAATEEPLYTQDAQHDAAAPGAADAPTPPAPVALPRATLASLLALARFQVLCRWWRRRRVAPAPAAPPPPRARRCSSTAQMQTCWLSTQLVNEDALEDALAEADVPTLCALKGVSLAWRARARRVLCARLCARVGLPLTSNLVEVTELDLSDSRAAGRLFADAVDASRWLPNLAKVTGLGGFEVDVAALRRVASSGEGSYPTAGVQSCIRGKGKAPMEVLLAACALRHGEARVPANAFRDDMSMRSIALPAGITSLGEGAFRGCSSLTSIALPAGLMSMSEYAFAGCSSLTSIELSASLTSLGKEAFSGCSSLTSIELPAGLTSLGEDAFQGCSSMTSITLPAGLTSVGEGAFRGCSSMTSIELPAGFTSLSKEAFSGCSSLTSIELPAGLTSIGDYAFEDCSSMTSIELPASLTSLGKDAFESCSLLSSVKLPAGLTSIGDYAFCDCSSMTSIELPAGLTSIGKYAFEDCSSLTSIELPTGLTSLGFAAFDGCSSMTSIKLPAGPTSLSDGAFYGCTSLTYIELPASFDLRMSSFDLLISADVPPSTILRFAPAFAIENVG